MTMSPRRSSPRWIGLVASFALLVLVAGAVGLSSGRVRERIPGLASAPLPTVTPAGLVISLAQLPDAGAAAPPMADMPLATIGSVATVTPRPATAPPVAAVVAASVAAPAPALATNGGVVSATRPPDTALAATVAPPPTPVATVRVVATPVPTAIAPAPTASPMMATATGPPVPAEPPPATAGAAMPVSPTAVPMPAPTVTLPPAPTAMPAPAPLPTAPPKAVFLQPMSHWFQTWNNCAGVATAMAISYFGLPTDPLVLSSVLRPNTNDKGVDTWQMVDYLESRGLKAQSLEGGTIDRVRRLVAVGAPVIVEQWQNRTDHAGVGHYRTVRGYDDAKQVFIANDSMVGASITIPYAEFDDLWGFYNFRYIPVWNDKLAPAVTRVLGDETDAKVNIARSLAYMQTRVEQQPQNAELQYGLGNAYFLAGDDERALAQFRKAREMGLLRKYEFTVVYQYWPVSALVNTGQHDEALQLAQENINRAGTFGEMHYERGRVFEARGDLDAARRSYRAALVDDKNLKEPQIALARLGG